MITKYFAYKYESDSLRERAVWHSCGTYAEAARDAMSHDGYAHVCREITADDLPKLYVVVDAASGEEYARLDTIDGANEAMATEMEDNPALKLKIEQVSDESEYNLGDYGLWAKGTHHGNNHYTPEGVRHPHFRCSGVDADECYENFAAIGGEDHMHMRHHIVVCEAIFGDDGTLIEADGVPASELASQDAE